MQGTCGEATARAGELVRACGEELTGRQPTPRRRTGLARDVEKAALIDTPQNIAAVEDAGSHQAVVGNTQLAARGPGRPALAGLIVMASVGARAVEDPANIIAVVVTAATLHTIRKPKIYMASASVVVDPRPPEVFGNQLQETIQLGSGGYWSNREYLNTEIDLLQTYNLARQTIVENKLHKNPKLVPPIANDNRSDEQLIAAATGLFLRGLSASGNRDNRIVHINVRHTDPEIAAFLANKHVETYTNYTVNYRSKGSGEVSSFLAGELDRGERKLRESERKLIEFKRDNDIISVALEDKQNILARDLTRYTAALSDARIKRIDLGAVRDYAKNLSGDEVLESPIFALASNSETVEALKSRYMSEKHTLAEIGEELGPRHPAYKSQSSKVDEVYTTIQNEARRAMREIEARYQTALKSERQFTAEVARLKQVAFELGPKTVEYGRLKREQESDEDNYKLVLGRLRTSELSGRNTQIHIRPRSSAMGAFLVYPRLKKTITMATILALMLGLALVFGLHFLDRSIKSVDQVESVIRAPFLGIIPAIGPADNRDLYVFNNPNAPATECCRAIRTNILFSSPDRPMKTITISSPQPREGKTTTTIYLGTIMAQSGHKVLLVDSDMRRPRLHKALGTSRDIGLTSLVFGEATLDDAIKTTDVPNLYLLPCGPQPPNPSEILLTNKFAEILASLEERFDYVLLDSPPLMAVTDGVIMARRSDGVVLVTQAGTTRIDEAKQSARLLRDVDATILGVILNDIDLNDRRYYYYRGYAANYGEEAAADTSS